LKKMRGKKGVETPICGRRARNNGETTGEYTVLAPCGPQTFACQTKRDRGAQVMGGKFADS